jgi:hypothetical protein
MTYETKSTIAIPATCPECGAGLNATALTSWAGLLKYRSFILCSNENCMFESTAEEFHKDLCVQ